MTNADEIITELRISALRRVAGVVTFLALSVVLLWVSVQRPPILYLQILMIAGGIGALFGARAVWRSGADAVVLTAAGLHDTQGTPIAPIEEIEAVDGGFFAFRPSNGFTVRLRTGASLQWRPGLWWRIGRRIGVGGMTPRQSGKLMSNLLGDMIKERATQENDPQR